MTRQTAAPLVPLRTSTSLWSIEEYTTRIRSGEMILDAPYQRGPVWTNQQRMDLVRSWLLGVPVPAVVLNHRDSRAWLTIDPPERVSYAVIDGRQRLETALAWLAGDLTIPASWLPADWIATTHPTSDGPYVTVTDLAKPRLVTRMMDLTAVIAHLDTVEAEATVYLLINGAGTAQTPADLRRAAAVVDDATS